MDFYTVSYVESQITSGHTLGFVIFVVVLLALLGVGIQVLRNGFTSRYRDLTVILSLVIVFFLGLEYQEYGRMKVYSEDSSRMAQFLHSFSADRGVDEGQLAVNSLKVRNGIILKVSDAYYEVQFNPEFTAKLAIGLLAIILQINLMGKGNLAPTSALDQLQNYVLGGIIGAIIYNDAIGILQFMLVLILWTILVMTLKFLKGNLRFFKTILDGHPVIVIEKGHILTEECMRYGIQSAELKLKLRTAGVQYVADVKRAVLEQNGQLSVVQFGEENIRFDLINDGQINQFTLDVIEKDKEWLEQEVQAQGYSIKDIYIAEYRDGKVVLYPYEKKHRPQLVKTIKTKTIHTKDKIKSKI